MKRFMPSVLGGALLPLGLAFNVCADTPPPGQIDFGAVSAPTNGGEFVEVNVSDNLISLATKLVERDQPDIAQMLKGLKLVHVKVIGLDDQNRGDIEERIAGVRQQLETKGWERVVKVQEKDQDVGVYLKTQNKDTIQGLVVMVVDGRKEAVFVNVVGDIKPEQLSMLGDTLHIDPLKNIGKKIHKHEPVPEDPEKP